MQFFLENMENSASDQDGRIGTGFTLVTYTAGGGQTKYKKTQFSDTGHQAMMNNDS